MEEIPDEWRSSTLIPIFKNVGITRELRLTSHTLKIWERIIEKRLREEVLILDQQFGFMPGRSTTDAIFALRQLREIQRRAEDPALHLH